MKVREILTRHRRAGAPAVDSMLAHTVESMSDLATSTGLCCLFADVVELSIRADAQSGSNVTSPHYVNS